MSISTHLYDLPKNVTFKGDIAIDTEATGLCFNRDRLCLVQLSDGNGDVHMVHFPEPKYDAPNLTALLEDPERTFIFHYARFDVALLLNTFNVLIQSLFCTKIASRLCRTYTDSHGLKDLCRELLNITLSKQQQSSDWAHSPLSKEQIEYAAADVLYLHRLRTQLTTMLEREERLALAQDCFAFLPTRAAIDLCGWNNEDIFAH
jgi:ribonuclease D